MKCVSVVPKLLKNSPDWKGVWIWFWRMKVRHQLLKKVSINFDDILNYEQKYDLENLTVT